MIIGMVIMKRMLDVDSEFDDGSGIVVGVPAAAEEIIGQDDDDDDDENVGYSCC